MQLTQSQVIAAVADRAEMSKADAKRALHALDEIVLEELGSAQKVRLGGLVQLTVRVKPATKKRPGRSPATSEESRSQRSRQASTCGHLRWPRRAPPCRRCRRLGAGSRRRTVAPRAKAWPHRHIAYDPARGAARLERRQCGVDAVACRRPPPKGSASGDDLRLRGLNLLTGHQTDHRPAQLNAGTPGRVPRDQTQLTIMTPATARAPTRRSPGYPAA